LKNLLILYDYGLLEPRSTWSGVPPYVGWL